ncbi:zeta toxin family protein [bacterium]|nr:zeta toxin family protein [bacterium]
MIVNNKTYNNVTLIYPINILKNQQCDTVYKKQKKHCDYNINFKQIPYKTFSTCIPKTPIWKDKNFAKILDKIISNPSNILGEGISSIVYSLEEFGINDLVIKFPRSCEQKDIYAPFHYVKDICPDLNIGQPIASNTSGISILKKIEGYAHGIPISNMLNANCKISYIHAKSFLEQLKVLSEFKDSAYIDLAQQFKVINKTNRYFVDTNPNNLMVDVKNQKLTVIDLLDKNQMPMYEKYKSDVNALISLCCDGITHIALYNQLSDSEKKLYKQYSETIIEKCKKAAKIAKLERSEITMGEYYDLEMNYDTFKFNRKHNGPWSNRHNAFRQMYPNIIPSQRICPLDKELKTSVTDIIRRFQDTEQIPDYYLSSMYNMKLLDNENIIEIIEQIPEKISKIDMEYFVQNRVPLTRYDTTKIIESRLNCLNATEINEQSREYIEHIDTILKTEFEKLKNIPNGKKMVIVTGLPASGKSRLIKSRFKKDYYIADIDIIKYLFPSYEKEGKRLNNLHSITKKILQQDILPKVIEQGKNVVIPTTGISEYIVRLATPAKKQGYDVEIIHCSALLSESIQNVIERFEREGRFVDPYFVMLRAPYMEEPFTDLKDSKLIDKMTVIRNI